MPPFKTKQSQNGHPAPTPLETRLAAMMKPDEVSIGSPNFVGDATDDSVGWDVVAKLVAGIVWLLKRYVPYGMLTGIIAEPKIGKSAFALDSLVRPVVTGCNWFTGLPGPAPGYAVWCDTEGSAGINVTRAKDYGLPLDRVKVPFPDDPLKPINIDDAEHLTRLFNVICRYQAKLLVVDSFRGAHGGDENNSKIAGSLQHLATIAEQTKAAVCIIHHTKKLALEEDINANSGRGSNAFLAMVRCQIGIDRPDPKSEWRRVQVLGENLGTAPPPVGFRFTDTGLEFGAAPARPRKKTEKDDVALWLRQRLKPGETYNAAEILAEARQHGHAERTVRKALVEVLGVAPEAVRTDGKISAWLWKLPGGKS